MTDIQIYGKSAGQGGGNLSYSYRVPENFYGKTAYVLVTYTYSPVRAGDISLAFNHTGYDITKTHVSTAVIDADYGSDYGKTWVYEGTLQGGTIEVTLSGWDRKSLTVMVVVK